MLNVKNLSIIAGTVAAVSLLTACGGSAEDDAQPVSGRSTSENASGRGGNYAASGSGSRGKPAAIPEGVGIDRLRQALSGAPVASIITRSERLEEIRAWLAENEPGMTDRQREAEAQLLALIDELFDGEDMTMARLQGMGELQLVQFWGADADGDGQLTEAEAQAMIERQMKMEWMDSPLFAERFDLDGDGLIAPAERQAVMQDLQTANQRVLDEAVERVGLMEWDSNGDGVLSAAEREAGEGTLDFRDLDSDGQIGPMERMMVLGEFAQRFMVDSMSMIPVPEFENPQFTPPDRMLFDDNGDGQVEGDEAELYQQAMRAAGEQFQEAAMGLQLRMMQEMFGTATTMLDEDGNSRLNDDEWEHGYATLRDNRDRQTFRTLYDADGSGRVDDTEVAWFMDRFESGSIAADANLDGRVDPGDLQHIMRMLQLQ
jgi:hypothetical protein